MLQPGSEMLTVSIRSADDLDWDDAADVIVVGYGGAGVVAAIQAREEGADVLALDRFGGGGATWHSGGVLYGGATPFQREAGFEDTPEAMFDYLKAEKVPLKDETLRRYCEGSNADVEWLSAHGVPYGSNAYLEKTAFPPDPHWLYYSGNENTAKFRAIASPAPRGHRVATPGNGGWLYMQKLRTAADRLGVRSALHIRINRLVVDDKGRVLGVEASELPQEYHAEHEKLCAIINPWKPFINKKAEQAIADVRALEAAHGILRLIRAHHAVILCSGGFIYNLEMLAKYQPEVARSFDGLLRLGSMGCDGSGIQLGMAAGGRTDLMGNLFIGSPLSPPLEYVAGGILVNRKGQRFTAEDAYHADIGNAVIKQPECTSWLIMEGITFWKAMKQSAFVGKGLFMTWGLPPLVNALLGGTKRGASLEKLAKKIGVDPGALVNTVAQFNATAEKGGPDPFEKSPEKLRPIRKGPFYAVNMSIDNYWSPTMAFTLGGLVVDEETGEVQRESGGVIPGLYAAGRAAVGICSAGYMSGLAIADTVFSGRRAGRHAAQGKTRG